MEKRFEGEIVSWNQTKYFGFIAYGRKRIYFSPHTIRPDWKGSSSWAFNEGIPVSFSVEQRTDTKSGRLADTAIDVAPIFPMSEPENLHGYRETSVVRQKKFDVVFLTRPCGDILFCHRNDVANDPDRWDLLTQGSPVYHGVRYDADRERWRADSVELYSFEELYEFQHEDDPPVEPELIIEREPEPEPELETVLASSTRNKPLIQLIMEKRGKL
jgi:hypothetical protein